MTICIHNGIVLSGLTSNQQRSAVLIEDSKIKDTFSEERFSKMSFGPKVHLIDAKGNYIIPGFIDTHIHGFKGNGTDTCTTEGILQMSKDLAQYGVTAFNPTMYSSSMDDMKEKIKAIVRAMGHEEGARIMGIHLEGPFISPEKLGVHRPETLKLPDIKLFDELWEAAEAHIVNMTVAPELKGMRELALHCIEKGVILQAGHTNATYENIVEGIQVGILHSTHFFNAMSQLHHRNPGTVGAILIHPEVSCEIIADGVHVHPDLFKLLGRDKNRAQIVLITDGGENCGGDPCAFAKSLMAQRSDIHIDVVLVSSNSRALKCLANTTGGKFYRANSYYDFSNVVTQSMSSTKDGSTIDNTNIEQYQTPSQIYEFIDDEF